MAEGVKHDADKPRCGLVLHGFARALTLVCEVVVTEEFEDDQ